MGVFRVLGAPVRARQFLAAPLLIVCSSCTPHVARDSPSADGTARLDQPFQLRVGDTALIAGDELRVWLISVSNDSRCPRDVQCVTAGDAVVRLAVSKVFGNRAGLELHALGGAAATHENFSIKVADLSPVPRAGEPIPARDYVVTLVVTKH